MSNDSHSFFTNNKLLQIHTQVGVHGTYRIIGNGPYQVLLCLGYRVKPKPVLSNKRKYIALFPAKLLDISIFLKEEAQISTQFTFGVSAGEIGIGYSHIWYIWLQTKLASSH